MTIRKSFEAETIEANGTFLDDDEENQLFVELQKLIEVQKSEDAEYTREDAQELAGLAFVAGRTYQNAQGSTDAAVGEAADAEGVWVKLSHQTIDRLLSRAVSEIMGD